jgi:negative regulator of flagellin synthesis FlgM
MKDDAAEKTEIFAISSRMVSRCRPKVPLQHKESNKPLFKVKQMKIETTYPFAPTPAARATAKSVGAEKSGDQVRLSDALQLHAAEAPVDSDRVQEIKQAIAEGRFRINPEAIADRLISTAQELIDAQRQA